MKILKAVVIIIIAAGAVYLVSKFLFIRTVNYEIAGISIPSRYNVITGKVTPIVNYKGKAIRKTVRSHKADKLGLSEEAVASAQLRWALFEQWANARSQYKGWDADPEIFKKADEQFKKELAASGLARKKQPASDK